MRNRAISVIRQEYTKTMWRKLQHAFSKATKTWKTVSVERKLDLNELDTKYTLIQKEIFDAAHLESSVCLYFAKFSLHIAMRNGLWYSSCSWMISSNQVLSLTYVTCTALTVTATWRCSRSKKKSRINLTTVRTFSHTTAVFYGAILAVAGYLSENYVIGESGSSRGLQRKAVSEAHVLSTLAAFCATKRPLTSSRSPNSVF